MTGTMLNILVVADESAGQTGAGLARHGFESHVVGSVEEALWSAAVDPPDVILLDFTTHGVDGPELARALRDQTRDEQPLLIAVTVHQLPEATRELGGIDLYLAGPVGSAILFDVLARFRDFLLAGNRDGTAVIA